MLRVGPALQRFQHLVVGLFPRLELPGLVRLSFGLQNTEEDVAELITVLRSIVNKTPAGLSWRSWKEQIAACLRAVSEATLAVENP